MKLTSDTPPNGDYVAYVDRLMAEATAAANRAGAIQQSASRAASAPPAPRAPAPSRATPPPPATRKPTTGVPSRAGSSSASAANRKAPAPPPAPAPIASPYRSAPPPNSAPMSTSATATPGAVPPPFNPSSLIAGVDGGNIVKYIVWMVAGWFALGVVSSVFPEIGGLVPVAVIAGIVWLFFKIKASVKPETLAQWRTQLERAAAEAARHQRK